MNAFRFARLPANSSIAAVVTLVVSGWLTVAGGVMVASPTVSGPVAQAVAAPFEAAPQVRERITVTASRADAGPQISETIVVTAGREAAFPETRERITVTASRRDAEGSETLASRRSPESAS